MTLASGPVLGSAAAGGSGLPADGAGSVPPADVATAAVALPAGSVWAAQIGPVGVEHFVLLVAGMPFDVPGAPPAAEGGTLTVRVAEDATPPVFEVLARERPHAQNAAVRTLLAHLLRRTVGADGARAVVVDPVDVSSASPRATAEALRQSVHDQLTRPTDRLTHYLETNLLRLDLRLPPLADSPRWRVEIRDTQDDAERQDDGITATVSVELPDLGAVEARLTLSSNRLRVQFVVERDEVRQTLLDGVAELAGALAAAGFTVAGIAADADPARLARHRVTDELPRESPRPGGLLDIRA